MLHYVVFSVFALVLSQMRNFQDTCKDMPPFARPSRRTISFRTRYIVRNVIEANSSLFPVLKHLYHIYGYFIEFGNFLVFLLIVQIMKYRV